MYFELCGTVPSRGEKTQELNLYKCLHSVFTANFNVFPMVVRGAEMSVQRISRQMNMESVKVFWPSSHAHLVVSWGIRYQRIKKQLKVETTSKNSCCAGDRLPALLNRAFASRLWYSKFIFALSPEYASFRTSWNIGRFHCCQATED